MPKSPRPDQWECRALVSEAVTGWLDEQAEAHGRSNRRQAGLYLEGIVQLAKRLEPHELAQLEHILRNPDTVTDTQIRALLINRESKRNRI